MGENLSGSIEIFAKALNMTEKEMFKMMEQGKLLSKDVLPLVGKVFSKTARENGALAAAQKKTRAELNRMTNAFTEIKEAIYKGGFGKGLAFVFKTMADLMQSSKGVATLFGTFLKSAMITLAAPLKVVSILLKAISHYFNIGENEAARFAAKLLGIAAAMWGIVKAAKMVKAVLGIKMFKEVASKLTGGTATSTLGKVAGTGAAGGIGAVAMTAYEAFNWALKSAPNQLKYGSTDMQLIRGGGLSSMAAAQKVLVNVKVNDGKVEGLIEAKVDQANSENINSFLSSGTK